MDKLLPPVILPPLDLGRHCLQIHGLLDNVVVVLDGLLVDGLHEGPGLLHGLDVLLHDLGEDVGEGREVVVV